MSVPDADRLVFLLEYNGQHFSGSQEQAHRSLTIRTIQREFYTACEVLNLRRTRASHLAARTDKGVHSLGQVLMLDVEPQQLNRFNDLRYQLNAVLPEDLSIADYAKADSMDFHVRHHAEARWYRYLLDLSPYRPVFQTPRSLHHPKPLVLDALQHCANSVVGTHDFKAFKCPDTKVVDNICTVHYSQWSPLTETLWAYDIVATRYLYNMVRILVGTMLQAATPSKSEWCPQRFEALLHQAASVTREAAGPTAPACGLTLMAVAYKPPFQYFLTNPWVRALHAQLSQGALLA